jgi:3-deoxy-D-manno-octulosonate 8-phosphate phosphatase (KDO 8-P phosphatase)
MLDAIDFLVLDVDGVLTDGRIVYDSRGQELKFYHSLDGQGIRYWLRAGHEAAILTGRSSPAIRQRAKEVGIQAIYEDATDKWPVFEKMLKRFKRTPDRVCYVGDDLVDIPSMSHAGLAVAVANAVDEVKRVAHYVTRRPGGSGAVRETVELILKYQGRWAALMNRYQEQLRPDLPASRRPWRAAE